MVKLNPVHRWRRGRRVSDVGIISLILHMWRKVVIRWHCILERWGAYIIIVIIVQISPAGKVGRSFVFMSSSILSQCQHPKLISG